MPLDWLPPLILLPSFGGHWTRYEAALYQQFQSDFVSSRPTYEGKRVGLKRYPILDGKEATFWHLTSQGEVEAGRLPDLRRCERIAWPRAIIERTGDPAIKAWKNSRGTERRICLWLEQEEYLVILSDRDSYVLPWTAYLVTEEHRKRKLSKEYSDYREGQKG